MLQRMKINDDNVNIPSDKNKLIIMGSKTYWTISIKEKNQWFPFHSILKHTAGIIKTDKSLITLILKDFAMFQMSLFEYKHNEEEKKVESIFIKCSNCDRITGLLLKVKTVK